MRLSPRLLVVLFAAICAVGLIVYFVRSRNGSGPDAAQKGPKTLWTISTGSRLLTAPSLGPDGTIYVGSQDGLYAISTQGKLLWKHPVSGGMNAPPVVGADGIIYITAAPGSVQSVNPDGTSRWDSRYPSIAFWAPPALGSDGTVYVTNYVSDLYAFKPDAAEPRLWTLPTERDALGQPGLPGEARAEQPPNMAPPAIGADGNLYVPRQHWLHSISPDGKERWTTFLSNGILGAVAMGGDGTIYVGNDRSESGVYAVNSDGSIRRQEKLRGIVRGSPVIDAQGNIYFGLDTELAVLAPDGSVKWEIKQPAGSPVLAQDGTIYVGLGFDYIWYLAALNNDGTFKWKWKLPAIGFSAPVIGSDGTIYMSTHEGEVWALRDSGSPLMSSAWPKYQHDSQCTGQMRQ